MASELGLEETELRLGLGLPGGGGGGGGGGGDGEGAKKRGFEETIDLKLQLQMPSDAGESEAALESPDNMGKKTLSPMNTASWGGGGVHPEKPPASKAQAVGWPPVRSFRKNILSVHSEKRVGDSKDDSGNSPAAFVKVSMDGAPYLRKVDLKMYRSYQELSMALQKMFSSFTTSTGMSGRDYMNESKVMDLLNGSEYVPTYEDKDGDWMLVGDVPWEMFVDSCKRLRIMKGSEAIGIAPKAMEKCKNRS